MGGFARDLVGVRIGGDLDAGDMADGTWLKAGHCQHRLGDRPEVLVHVVVVGDVPALDNCKRLTVSYPPFDRVGGRIGRPEPGLRRRFVRCGFAGAAAGDDCADRPRSPAAQGRPWRGKGVSSSHRHCCDRRCGSPSAPWINRRCRYFAHAPAKSGSIARQAGSPA